MRKEDKRARKRDPLIATNHFIYLFALLIIIAIFVQIFAYINYTL